MPVFLQEGEKLTRESRSAEVKVGPRLREVTENWESLVHNCKEKKSRLQEAYQVKLFLMALVINSVCL